MKIYTVKQAQKHWARMWKEIRSGETVYIKHKKKYFIFVNLVDSGNVIK